LYNAPPVPGSTSLTLLQKLILVAILAVAMWLRLAGVGVGLPYRVGVDEPALMEKSVNIMKSGDFHPHFWDYPGFTIYLHSAVASVRFLYGAMNKEWSSLEDDDVWPGAFYHWSRIVTALIGTLTVFIVFRSATRWGPLVGLIAAAAMAVQPQHVRESHFALTDIPLTFFVALTFLLSQRAAEGGRFREFFVAGVATGLAIATKYNGAVALLMPFTVVFLSAKPETRVMSIIAVMTGTLGGFIAAAPYSVLDLPGFLNGFAALMQYYNAPRAFSDMASTYFKFVVIWFGYPGQLPRWIGYPAVMLFVFGGLMLLADLRQPGRRGPALAALLFPLTYFWFVSNQSLQFGRYLMPIVPMLSIGVAIGIATLRDWVARRAPARTARFALPLLLLVLLPPALTARSFVLDQRRVSTEEQVGRWLTQNVKPNERIVFEAALQLPPRFKHERVLRLTAYPLAQYRSDGTVYLVASSAEYDKYFNDPARFASQITDYNELFKATELVMTFTPSAEHPGATIRVMKLVR
jgi:4-amino-4-deoxy-L-arabinose transferase-like glycosyltransferase